MSEHRATIDWQLETAEFAYESYNRSHALTFDHGVQAPGAAAPANIPASAVGAPGVDPEQAFVAALSSCHMLWFLHLACNRKFKVTRYRDEAVGVLEKRADGKEAITRVTLRPVVSFGGTGPTPEQHAQLHEKAHERCFIANSVNSEVAIEPSIAP
ncbi:MAG TPA: OsmC family protein [Burkholderiales bacterium]|jgi:organic hydroperoxide reductase OsmC/OhrA|nr:OsmC family protein [Burkholderiales bacterium]